MFDKVVSMPTRSGVLRGDVFVLSATCARSLRLKVER
jgi:hypothetical protein